MSKMIHKEPKFHYYITVKILYKYSNSKFYNDDL